MENTLSLETMNFQINSQLGQHLDTFYTKLLEVSDKFTETWHGRKESEYQNAKKQYIFDYLNSDNGITTLVDIFKKYAGVDLVGIHCESQFLAWWTYGQFKSVDDWYYAARRSEGTGEYDSISNPKMTAADFLELSKSFDTKTGKVDPNKTKIPVSMVFGLGVYDYCLLHDFLPNKFERMTPREATAVTLHEIGHVLTVVERACDSFNLAERQVELNTAFTKNASTEEKLKLLENRLESPEAQKRIPKKLREASLAAVKAALQYKQKKYGNESLYESIQDNIITRTISTLCYLLFAIFSLLMNIAFINTIGALVYSLDIITFGSVMAKSNDKSGEYKNTDFFLTYSERWSDEYATRHGYGKELMSSLRKLTKYCEISNYPFSQSMREGRTSYELVKIITELSMLIHDPIVDTNYEFQINRFKRIAQNLIPIFKKSKEVPPAIMDEYLKDYETMLDEINDQIKNTKFYRSTTAMILLFVSEIPKAISNAIHNKSLDDAYIKLMNKVEELIRNPMFYSAAKLGQIYRKR